MAKTYFTYRCGHDGVGHFDGNSRDRDRKGIWYGENHDCEQYIADARKEACELASEAATVQGLPCLSGTEKQITWAKTLRKYKLDTLKSSLEFIQSEGQKAILEKMDVNQRYIFKANIYSIEQAFSGNINAIAAILEILKLQSTAKFWIESRDESWVMLRDAFKTQIEAIINPKIESKEEIEAKEEALLKPSIKLISNQVAEITFVKPFLRVSFPEKIESFRLLMRGYGFAWNKTCWERTLTFTSGDPIERMAEIASYILNLGIMVRLFDDEAKKRAINADFKPEERRWLSKVSSGKYAGWLCLSWPVEDDFYDAAKKIIGSRWNNKQMMLPAGSVNEAFDFFDLYGFSTSDGAKEILRIHQEKMQAGILVKEAKKPPKPKKAIVSDKPEIIHADQSQGIDDELRDSD